ncbi:MAG: regulator of chromosome condensation [Labilithrix sp.]|nr:regulator of chromosome condensation [Labilithrix sp.]
MSLVIGACGSLRLADTDPEDGGTGSPDDPSTRPDGSSDPDDELPDAESKSDGGKSDDGNVDDSGTGNAKVESITVGENVACVVFGQGVMRCWGNYLLAGGGNTATPKPSPIPIRTSDGGGFLTGVAEVTASYRHACARLLSGGFACWGYNNEYQLGDFTRDINASKEVSPFARFVKDASIAGPTLKGPMNLAGRGRVSAGVAHSAAVIDGAALTWGYISGSSNGPLGRGDPDQSDAIVPKPVLALGGQSVPADDRLLGVKTVDLARTHGCAALDNNTVACWGDNGSGKLGIGSGVAVNDGRPRRVVVPDSTGLLRVATGDTSSCAMTAMGRVRCWGQNNVGQSGKDPVGGSQQDVSLDVKTIANQALDRVIDVGVGDGFACALTEASAGGKVYCWGTGAGSVLGDGTTTARALAGPVASALAPAKVDLEGVRLLAVGDSSACVVLGDRDVRCWGQGPIGEAGESSSTSTIPRAVDDL